MLEICKRKREERTLRRRGEAGETLVEILITVVIMGLVVGAIFATYSAAATTSKSQRDFVTADAELRDYAEALHAATQNCTPGDALTLAPPVTPYPYAVATDNPPKCPAATAVEPIEISVTPTNGTPAQKLITYLRSS